MSQIQIQIKNQWHYILHKLFDHPSVVLIGGTWKSGKTDFALRIAESLIKLPSNEGSGTVITQVATNIDTKGHFPDVHDLFTLRQWLYAGKERKLYILDEANEHLPSRRAMTTKSVDFVQLIPEISKAHGRLLVIGHQLLTIDKTFLDEVWCRGIFIKLGLKKAQLISHLLPRPYRFDNIPATSISFDPYAIAPFQEKPTSMVFFKDEDKQLLWKWANGSNYHDLGLKPMQLHRKLQKYILGSLQIELNG